MRGINQRNRGNEMKAQSIIKRAIQHAQDACVYLEGNEYIDSMDSLSMARHAIEKAEQQLRNQRLRAFAALEKSQS